MPRLVRLLTLLLLLASLTACPATNTPTASSQLPNLAGYQQYEGEEISDDIGDASGVLAFLFRGDPRLAVVAQIVSSLGSCAQEQGVVNWRVYVREDDPSAAGVVVVASQSRATDPAVLLTCTAGSFFVPPEGLSPCTNAYTYQTDEDTFYVLYGASKESVCADFQGALPGPS